MRCDVIIQYYDRLIAQLAHRTMASWCPSCAPLQKTIIDWKEHKSDGLYSSQFQPYKLLSLENRGIHRLYFHPPLLHPTFHTAWAQTCPVNSILIWSTAVV